MPQIRRSADRRRRVIYQTQTAAQPPSTPAARRDAERLRAARQPAKTFGSRVDQPLRGRWFSLVPVSRVATCFVASMILAIPALLTTLHYASYTWTKLAYNEAVARPFRIQMADSFASWWISIGLLISAGATLLIFQLRRHRADDYRGHYRLWRIVLIVLLVANLNHTVGFIQWLGALLDLAFGNRTVMSGANWLRIVLDVGGVILAMQLVAEVFRCRSVLISMLATIFFLGFMELATWNVITIESAWAGTLLLASPMLAASCYLMGATLYLRTLYRQARNITHHASMRDQLTLWWAEFRDSGGEVDFPEVEPAMPMIATTARPAASSPVAKSRNVDPKPQEPKARSNAPQNSSDDDSSEEPAQERRGLFSRFKRQSKKQDDPSEQSKSAAAQSSESDEESETAAEKKSRRGLFRRRAKESDASQSDSETDSDQPASPKKAKKKGRFSLRLRPQQQDTDGEQQATDADSRSSEDDDQPPAEKKPGLFSRMFARKPKPDFEPTDADGEDSGNQGQSNRQQANGGRDSKQAKTSRNTQQKPAPLAQRRGAPQTATESSDDDDLDPDDIDWNSLSKSERRRLRKKLKRSGHAA